MHIKIAGDRKGRIGALLGVHFVLGFTLTVMLLTRAFTSTDKEALFLKHVTPMQVSKRYETLQATARARTRTTHFTRATQKPIATRKVTKQSTVAVTTVSTAVKRAAPILHKSADDFPAFQYTQFPVNKTPNWGAMHSSFEWNRSYSEMVPSDFVPVPEYDLEVLTIPMLQLTRDRQEVNVPIITSKLFYSTRFLGRYSYDAAEYSGNHPGIDLKLAPGTPIGAIAGGKVITSDMDQYLGNYVMIEHELPDTGQHVVSIYGHLESRSVKEGESVAPGDIVGVSGSTGRSSAPHLHLQVDIKKGPGGHEAYIPGPSLEEASLWTLNPVSFIERYRARL